MWPGTCPLCSAVQGVTIEDGIVLDKIFSAAQAPSMAQHMVGIYEMLNEAAAEQGEWAEKAAGARKLAGSL